MRDQSISRDYQQCTVHFYRNIFPVTPRNKMKTAAMMLKAIHAQESKEAACEKARSVSDKLKEILDTTPNFTSIKFT